MIKLTTLTEKLNVRGIEVRPIQGEKETELFNSMIQKHYLRNINKSVSIRLGIFTDGNMVGIAAYGPPTYAMIAKQFNLNSNEVYELRRFYTEENDIHNLESQAIVLANDELKKLKPMVKVIVTYADSKQGHVGTLYQATNAKYMGESGGKYKYIYIIGSKSERKNTEKRMSLQTQPYPKKDSTELNEFQSEGFDLDKFLKMTTFAAQIRYANANLQRLASGSARIIYVIDDNTVLKLAKNIKGIAQNEAENSLSNDYMVPENIIAKVLEADEKDRWIVMERAKKIGKARFRQLMDGIDIDEFYSYLYNNSGNTDKQFRRPVKDQEKLDNNEFAQDLLEFINNFDFQIGDFARPSSFGEIDGRLVITDYGLTKDVYQTHYKNW